MKNYAQELFLLSTNLSQLKDKDRITSFFIESLNNIFTEYHFEWLTDVYTDRESIIEVCTRNKTYGYIKFTTDNSDDNTIQDLIHNSGQMLAIILEKLEQEEQLRNQKNNLQELVNEQTKNLIISRDEIKNITENSPDIIMRFDKDYRHTFVNSIVYDFTGIKAEDFIGKSHREMGFPDDQCNFWEEKIKDVIQNGKTFETDFDFFYNDKKISFNWRLIPEFDRNGKITSVLSISRDITEKKRSEEALKKSENLLSEIQKMTKLGSWEYDVLTNTTYFSEEIFAIYGLPNDHMFSSEVGLTFYHPDDRMIVSNSFQKAITEREPYNIIVRFINAQGQNLWVRTAGKPMIENGKVVKIIGNLADITQQKLDEETLRESEERLSLALDIGNAGVWEWNYKKDEIYFDARFHAMLDYMPGELPTTLQDFMAFIHPDEIAMVNSKTKDYLNGKIPDLEMEHRIKKKDGTWIWVLTRGKTIGFKKSEPPSLIIGISMNITGRKKADEEHLRLQNLESLGVLAGGIAHDFNNILSSVLGRASMVIDEVSDDKTKEDLIAIEKATRRAVSLTDQLLTFSKGGKPDKKVINLKKLILETTKFSLSGSNIESEFNLKDSLTVEADFGQISQVIQNLVINANQAMPNGGKIKISTENYLDSLNHAFVKIVLEDQGFGIPKVHIDKIFNPYFTTKQTGSGLGLSVCHSIIKRHEGKIFVNSDIGVGTSFTILLPATGKSIESKSIPIHKMNQKLRVLIMDDDNDVRELLSSMLKRSGHEVYVSKEGGETLEIYKDAIKRKEPFDLVFLDLTVKGGLGGTETIKILHEINPDVKAIVSSGYADSSISSYKEDGFDGILKKPYTKSELNEVIYGVFNKI